MSAPPQTTPAERPFVISRTFDAPRETVWKMWAEPEHFKKWFGPKGATVTEAKMDFKVGGTAYSCIRTPDGREMRGKFVYRAITPPERLVYEQYFCDAQGNIA